ncbi:MFS transporter [Litoreibacter janthinus]|uniref:MFS transporter, UMF1 family n=1 Tax=Litoreibacter janthinus TaxID=670154 RepID=A0A1I6FXH6_9RHOB|nr:MFS transporter [Litoreibacter janthinus]SFR34600.1 MFS transporter, UMF1 family [Litoreibacter janthinus]
MTTSAKKRIWGWFMFDWASQPYNTLLLTFIFGPYFAEVVTAKYVTSGMDVELAKASAQSVWGWVLTISGLMIAFSAPVLGAVADSTGRRLPYIWVFSVLYVIGAAGTWYADPNGFSLTLVMGLFIVGLVGMEFATIFTNAMLPELGTREEIGRISGSGWAMGYWGGLLALVFALLFLAENNEGRTLIGISPLGGLDSTSREGTRFVGVFSALWFIVFMVPFFIWVRDPKDRPARTKGVIAAGLRSLGRTIRKLPRTPSLANYLASSMLYRDALNGMYTFGGIYAVGVLGWSVVDVGVFGILAVIGGAIAAYLGGRADSRFGPKPVILVSIIALIIAAVSIVMITPTSIYGVAVSGEGLVGGRTASDIAFYLAGILVGAAGGTIQSASRTMMVRQANPNRMTEAFGLYALAGKATSFLAPGLIALTTTLSGSQRIGVTPLIGLFLLGLVLLLWVKPDGEDDALWESDI